MDLGRVAADLEDAAGTRVDLVDLGSATPVFVLGILQGRRVLLVDRTPEARVDWESLQASM
ncbi:MAG: hypothetical protein V3T05_03535, partial [Myxococcota bacterium]